MHGSSARACGRNRRWAALAVALVIGCGGLATPASARPTGEPDPQGELSAAVQDQIAAIAADKADRTPAEQKVDSNLLYAAREAKGRPAVAGAPELSTDIKAGRDGDVLVEISAEVTGEVLERIVALGGEVTNAVPRFDAIQASVPLGKIVTLAADGAIGSIRPADAYRLNQADPGSTTSNEGSGQSEADTTLSAAAARSAFGVDGAGVKVCAISDGVETLAARQASGDLPFVDVLPGQSGTGGTGTQDEGTAMLELIHDLAPAAELGFATANPTQAQFAQNILDLRNIADCDVIVDDVTYFAERTFQDSVVAQAINSVKADGAIFFTSATNNGNLADATSGTWQGDFSDGGASAAPLPAAGQRLHQWSAGVTQNTLNSSGGPINLEWADQTGFSANDYDLYILNSAGSAVTSSSTNTQDGTQNPQEQVSQPAAGSKVVVLKAAAAASRYLVVYTNRGRLAQATGGSARAHNGALNAVSVSAAPSKNACCGGPTGPFPNPYSSSSLTEVFTSDGPIRHFYKPDGTPYTPGNFSSTGGLLDNGPDITSSDGNTTTTPGFIPFFGTSAAAPDAAALAALALQAKPALTPAQLETAMKAAAIDIEAPGTDVTTGAGITMAPALMAGIGAAPKANLVQGTWGYAQVTGDGDSVIEPGEKWRVNEGLVNIGGATATNVKATLSSPDSRVVVTSSTLNFPNIAPEDSAGPSSGTLEFVVKRACPCGTTFDLDLALTYSGGYAPKHLPVGFTAGTPSAVAGDFAYSGPVVAIPDNSATGVSPSIAVGAGTVSSLTFSIDGTACTSAAGATTVGLDHTFMADLVGTLTSPSGTKVTLFEHALGGANNLCNTVLSDAASVPLSSLTTGSAPFTGTYRPLQPLSAFKGEPTAGNWVFKVTDGETGDIGSVRNFSLHITGATCDTFNQAPAANPDSFRALRNTALTKPAGALTANDSDPQFDPITAQKVTNPAHGTATVNANGSFTYTPASNFVGTDTFTYKVLDGLTDSDPKTVTILVQSPTQAYVEQGYLDFVGRLADAGGLSFWSNRIDNGTETRTSFIKKMTRSHEYAVKVVTKAYQDVLGRDTDPSGREFWAKKVQDGMPISTLTLNLMGSNEFLTKSGGTKAGFVNAAFQAILGRQPSTSERNANIAKLDSGTSQRQVALDLYNTVESRQRRVKNQYTFLLRRNPTTADYNQWVPYLATKSDIELAIALGASNEYYAYAQAHATV